MKGNDNNNNKDNKSLSLDELKSKFYKLHHKIFQREEILGSLRLDGDSDLFPEEDAVLDAMWDERNAILAQIHERGEWRYI